MGTVLVVQHALAERLGRIEPLLREAGLDTSVVRPNATLDPTLPEDAAGLIVLGGPMGVYESDRHPRLLDEMKLLENRLKKELPILGVCLGSELLAAVLGSKVRPGSAKEIGWHEVALTREAKDDEIFKSLPERFPALHWHGDVFDLPEGASHLARSAMTEYQAFRYGASAWGILFHLEAELPQIRAMAEAFPGEVAASGITVDGLLRASAREEKKADELAAALFGEWVRLVRRFLS